MKANLRARSKDDAANVPVGGLIAAAFGLLIFSLVFLKLLPEISQSAKDAKDNGSTDATIDGIVTFWPVIFLGIGFIVLLGYLRTR